MALESEKSLAKSRLYFVFDTDVQKYVVGVKTIADEYGNVIEMPFHIETFRMAYAKTYANAKKLLATLQEQEKAKFKDSESKGFNSKYRLLAISD